MLDQTGLGPGTRWAHPVQCDCLECRAMGKSPRPGVLGPPEDRSATPDRAGVSAALRREALILKVLGLVMLGAAFCCLLRAVVLWLAPR